MPIGVGVWRPVKESESGMARAISIDEFLRQKGENFAVPRGQEVRVDPDDDRFASSTYRLEVRSFEDLEKMSMVPTGLPQKEVMEALAKDDAESLDLAHRLLETRAKSGPCSCQATTGEQAPRKLTYRSELRIEYNGIRKSHNVHLARLLTNVHRRQVAWDSLLAAHTHGHFARLTEEPSIAVVVWLGFDLVIMHNATLHIQPSVSQIKFNNINIHVGGRLNVLGSYLKIKCESIQGNIP